MKTGRAPLGGWDALFIASFAGCLLLLFMSAWMWLFLGFDPLEGGADALGIDQRVVGWLRLGFAGFVLGVLLLHVLSRFAKLVRSSASEGRPS